MRSTGITRPVDGLGRVVIPMELRRSMRIREGDPVEIFVDGSDHIILQPCRLQCVCCGSTDEDSLKQVHGVHLCPSCIMSFGGASS